eukprot:2896400-Rhodomonas_salina.2
MGTVWFIRVSKPDPGSSMPAHQDQECKEGYIHAREAASSAVRGDRATGHELEEKPAEDEDDLVAGSSSSVTDCSQSKRKPIVCQGRECYHRRECHDDRSD